MCHVVSCDSTLNIHEIAQILSNDTGGKKLKLLCSFIIDNSSGKLAISPLRLKNARSRSGLILSTELMKLLESVDIISCTTWLSALTLLSVNWALYWQQWSLAFGTAISQPHLWLSHHGKHKDSRYWSKHEIESPRQSPQFHAQSKMCKKITNGLCDVGCLVGSERSKSTWHQVKNLSWQKQSLNFKESFKQLQTDWKTTIYVWQSKCHAVKKAAY